MKNLIYIAIVALTTTFLSHELFGAQEKMCCSCPCEECSADSCKGEGCDCVCRK